jgi:hypothetical protein
MSKLIPGVVALQGSFLQLLEFSGKLRRVRRWLLKITLRKDETAKQKNKKDAQECFQPAPPEQTALPQKIFSNRQPLYRRERHGRFTTE